MREPDASPLRAMRDLLRHLDDGPRLRENVLVIRCLGSSIQRLAREPQRLSWVVRQLIEEHCTALPPRQRAIIIRCDLGGEIHRSVASALGMSVRHLYRERRSAISALADRLMNSKRNASIEAPREPDPFALHDSHVDALQHAGHFGEAIAVLKTLGASATGTLAFVRIACRLVDLCCEAGLTRDAEEHLTAARVSIAALAPSDETNALGCELELATAQLAWRRADLDVAEMSARRVVQTARSLGRLWWRQRYDECVGAGLLMQSDVRHARGDFTGALTLAAEARELLKRPSTIRPALRLHSLTAVAFARAFLPGPLSRGLEEFGRAFEFASSHSLPREAARISSMICAMYIWRGELDRAISLGTAAVSAAHAICSDFEQAAISLDLATAYTLRRDPRSARKVLLLADKQLQGNTLTRGVSRLVAADTFICEGRFEDALDVARAGQQLLEGIPGGRFLGSALRVQADALEGLGERSAARARIKGSLELLTGSGHPFTLLRSYLSSARINHDRSHLATARHIMSELRQ